MKIMFICTSNVCRSAMAKALFEKIIENTNPIIEVYSCGIFAQTGDMASYNAIQAMKETFNIDLKEHRAINIAESQIEQMDLILCATLSHKKTVQQLYPHLASKVYTIKEYAGIAKEGQEMDIRDPWGYNLETYLLCVQELEECLQKIAEKILQRNEK